MSDNKDAQAARNAADRRLREAHPNDWRTFMQEEFAQRGLEWTPRPSKEERERKAAAEKEERALARIAKIAKDNGLSAEAANRVLIAVQGGEPTEAEKAVLANEHVSNAIDATFDGTAETVKVDRPRIGMGAKEFLAYDPGYTDSEQQQ